MTRSGRYTRQPHRVLADAIAGDEAKRWPGAGEAGLAAAEHEGSGLEAILVEAATRGEARREGGSGDVDRALAIRRQSARHHVDDVANEGRVRSARRERP